MSTIKIPSERLDQLRKVAGSGPVLILTHDNPDPDGLASGKALAYLFSKWGVESDLLYAGIISRSENKTMHNLLTPEWQQVQVIENLERYSAVAILDSQPMAGNNSLLNMELAQIVIDHHHPIRKGVERAPFADLRPNIGAASSMLFQYLLTAGIDITPEVATALFYGLKTDTRSLSRGASTIDEQVYVMLLKIIDHSLLFRVEQADLPRFFYGAVVKAFENTMVYGGAIIAELGEMYRPDFASEIADLLIRLEDAKGVLCLGVYEQTLHLSIRTIPLGEDAGKFVQKIIMPPGNAGGHGTMAGGQFPIRNPSELKRCILEFSQRFLILMGESPPGGYLLDRTTPIPKDA